MEKEINIVELGFSKIEIEAIEEHFLITLSMYDWESIAILDEEEEEDDNHFMLPTGRMVYFPNELLRKELLSQID